ncbi:hypothetical protein RCO28_22590 [Streptomyces sp. LHD-70]|uniref:hypothetical protein n=1 Tax=Streptomyces sp. LHD-70 TaxID=3072140 RepID=UPI00280CDB5E|nr:hypothetical protein [Streptomyces sp. LHD-70]MDQ8705263.1 hypothetical protein [Streptomyces sp. LHD-70]
MGLFDRLTGTRRPAAGVTPLPADDVRAALLALNGPEVPYVIHGGAPGQDLPERADLVAEWRISDPAWYAFFARTHVSRTFQVCLRLVTEKHEVRAVDRQWEVTWAGGTPTLSLSAEATRGQVRTTSHRWTFGGGVHGSGTEVTSRRFDSAALKDPLREAVLSAGWTWRGVVSGRL